MVKTPVDTLRKEAESTLALIRNVFYLKSQVRATSSLLREILDSLNNRGLAERSNFENVCEEDLEVPFEIVQSLKRFQGFLVTFLFVHDSSSEEFAFLKQLYAILNSKHVHSLLCERVRDIFGNVSNLLPNTTTLLFEQSMKEEILVGVSNATLLRTIDKLWGKQTPNTFSDIDKTLTGAIKMFCLRLAKNLEKKGASKLELPSLQQPSLFSNKKTQNDAEKLSKNKTGLSKALEVEMLKCVCSPTQGTDTLVYKSVPVHRTDLDEGKFGDLAAVRVNDNQRFKNSDTIAMFYMNDAMFRLVQEVEVIKSEEESNMMLPVSFQPENESVLLDSLLSLINSEFQFVYKGVKKSLDDLMCNNQSKVVYNFSEFEAIAIVLSVSNALHFLHSKGLVHNQLSPKNVYLCLHPVSIKIGNFAVNVSDMIKGRKQRLLEDERSDSLTFYENIIFSSPEIILSEKSLTSNDVYSLSCLIWKLLQHRHDIVTSCLQSDDNLADPAKALQYSSRMMLGRRLMKLIVRGGRPTFTEESKFGEKCMQIRAFLIDLAISCWSSEAHLRPDSAMLVKSLAEMFENARFNHSLSVSSEVEEILSGIDQSLIHGENTALISKLEGKKKKANKGMIRVRPTNVAKSLEQMSVNSSVTGKSTSGFLRKRTSRRMMTNSLKLKKNKVRTSRELKIQAVSSNDTSDNTMKQKHDSTESRKTVEMVIPPQTKTSMKRPKKKKPRKKKQGGGFFDTMTRRRKKKDKEKSRIIFSDEDMASMTVSAITTQKPDDVNKSLFQQQVARIDGRPASHANEDNHASQRFVAGSAAYAKFKQSNFDSSFSFKN